MPSKLIGPKPTIVATPIIPITKPKNIPLEILRPSIKKLKIALNIGTKELNVAKYPAGKWEAENEDKEKGSALFKKPRKKKIAMAAHGSFHWSSYMTREKMEVRIVQQ